MLLRYDPFRELDRLTDALAGRSAPQAPLDAYREGENFHVLVDLPGVDPSKIDLTVERDVLTIKAERTWPAPESAEVLVAERPQGSVTRRLLLGEAVDQDHIEARYDQGVLHIVLPVAERARVRKVEVASAGSKASAIEATHTEATQQSA
jgi:HSP20 family protein